MAGEKKGGEVTQPQWDTTRQREAVCHLVTHPSQERGRGRVTADRTDRRIISSGTCGFAVRLSPAQACLGFVIHWHSYFTKMSGTVVFILYTCTLSFLFCLSANYSLLCSRAPLHPVPSHLALLARPGSQADRVESRLS